MFTCSPQCNPSVSQVLASLRWMTCMLWYCLLCYLIECYGPEYLFCFLFLLPLSGSIQFFFVNERLRGSNTSLVSVVIRRFDEYLRHIFL